MSRFSFRLPLSVITERGPGGEVNVRSLIGFTISLSCYMVWEGKAIVLSLNPNPPYDA